MPPKTNKEVFEALFVCPQVANSSSKGRNLALFLRAYALKKKGAHIVNQYV